jgi:AcrR family transcriptional regulator
VLAAAAELFIVRGYTAVTIQDIADEAGLTTGGIYGHFRSKGVLLVEVIRWKLAERERDPEYLTKLDDPRAGVTLMTDPPGRGIRLLQVDAAAAARHDPDVAGGMTEFYTERLQAIRDALQDATAPDALSSIVNALSVGIGIQEAVGLPLPDEAEWIEVAATMVSAGYRTDHP